MKLSWLRSAPMPQMGCWYLAMVLSVCRLVVMGEGFAFLCMALIGAALNNGRAIIYSCANNTELVQILL